jgi:hypothetical protein
MALHDPQRKEDSELREDLSALRHEVREVITWQIYREAVRKQRMGVQWAPWEYY